MQDERPKILDRYWKAAELQKKAKKITDSLKPEVREILKHTNYKDIYLQKAATVKVDNDKAVALLEEKLRSGKITQDQYDSFFVMAFDQNAFLKAVRMGVIPRGDVGRDIAWREHSFKVITKVIK